MKRFKAIAAMSENRVIGKDNTIPWHLPEDFRWFKEITTGHRLVMGRRTFESIGKPLPGRETLVLSRSGFQHPGVQTIADLGEVDLENDPREAFICGGAQLYELALPICSDLFLTVVRGTLEGDTFFPPFESLFHLEREIRDHAQFRILHYINRENG